MTTRYRHSDFRHTVAAIACTILFSTACVLGAIGPAQADSVPAVAHQIAAQVQA